MAIEPLRFSLQTSFPYKVFALTVGLLYLQMALNVDQANYMRKKNYPCAPLSQMLRMTGVPDC